MTRYLILEACLLALLASVRLRGWHKALTRRSPGAFRTRPMHRFLMPR